MTRKDFEESVNAVLVENLEETLTPAELTKLQKEIVARVNIDWDPFEDPDPCDTDESLSESSYSYSDSEDDSFLTTTDEEEED